MAEEIDFENGRISNFQCHVTLNLTLDQAIRHTAVQHSSTPTYASNFTGIGETFCGQMDRQTSRLALLGRLRQVELIMLALFPKVPKMQHPKAHDDPTPGIPANICLNLILLETTDIGDVFAADTMGLSSFKFSW